MYVWPSTVGPKHNWRRSQGRAAPETFANDHRGLGQGTGVWKSLVGACSRPTRVRVIRWGNAREVPAGPQSRTIADMCIVKNVCFF